MLPMMILQPTDLTPFDTALNSASLLPQEASAPSAAFADILRLGVESGETTELAFGMPLPLPGNELPRPALPEFEGAASDAAVDVSIPPPDTRNVERIPLVPAAITSVEGSIRDALPSGTSPRIEPSAILPSVRQVPPASQVGLAPVSPVSPDAAELYPDSQQPREGKVHALATLPPSTLSNPASQSSPGQIARDLATAPLAGANAAQIAGKAAPTPRKPLSVPAPANPGRTIEPTLRLPESLPPSATPVREELPADIRPLPATASTLAPAQSQPSIASQSEVASGQQSQVSPLQAAPTQPPASTSTTTTVQLTESIDIPVKDPAWGERIGERVLMMAGNRLQSAEIRLTPAELGPLRIQVAVDDGAANITFLAQHAITRDAIEQALPRLRELLAENGLTLNQTNVGGQSEQGVLEGNPDDSDDAAGFTQAGGDAIGDSIVEDAAETARPAVRPDSLVDTFV